MRKVLFAVLTAFLLLATPAGAAPKAANPGECAAYADMALVASAFARQKVDQALTFTAMTEIYSGGMSDPRVVQIMNLIVSTAYRGDAATIAPSDFAGLLLGTCVKTHGDMDAILGSDV